MKNNIIWRNRANAILGVIVAIFPFVEGFPNELENIILFVLGLFITLFSVTGIRVRNNSIVQNNIAEPFLDQSVKTDHHDGGYDKPVYDVDQK